MFAANGVRVTGVDVNERVISTLTSGRLHIEEPGLDVLVQDGFRRGTLTVGTTIVEADAFIIAVPTPHHEDHSPDLSYVKTAASSVARVLRPGNLVILESTSPPGTTERLIPILEESGLKAGKEFFLAYSPERVLPGNILTELVENDRVIGGITPESGAAVAELYGLFVQGDILVSDSTTAEMAKLMENTYRDVNIALANEFGRIGAQLGIDIFAAIDMANHHPRVNILQPGPGVGGHCIAVDPWFIVHSAPELANLITMARQVNDQQPQEVVRLVTHALAPQQPAIIAVLGLAYKANVDDVRESPSEKVVTMLERGGHTLRLHDAHVEEFRGLPTDPDLKAAVDGADALVLLTDHDEYRTMDPHDAMFTHMKRRLLIDTRHCVDRDRWEAAGFEVHQLGVGRRSEGVVGAVSS